MLTVRDKSLHGRLAKAEKDVQDSESRREENERRAKIVLTEGRRELAALFLEMRCNKSRARPQQLLLHIFSFLFFSFLFIFLSSMLTRRVTVLTLTNFTVQRSPSCARTMRMPSLPFETNPMR